MGENAMTTQTDIELFLKSPTEENFKKINKNYFAWIVIYEKIEEKEDLLKHVSEVLNGMDFLKLLGVAMFLNKNFQERIIKELKKCEKSQSLYTLIDVYKQSSVKVKPLLLELVNDIVGNFKEWEEAFPYGDENLQEIFLKKILEFIK